MAALILRATGKVVSASVDELVLGKSHVGQVLRRFEAAMRRWRWDAEELEHPVRWVIRSERKV